MNAASHIATKIVKKLRDEGFVAYFAGGWVRDHLMGHLTDEVDIATSAPPEKVQALFPKTIAVGISFGVVVVVMEGKNFEVTTFRKDLDYQDGRHPSHVDFSTPEKDASRRDFTINGMFYDPLTEEIHDYVGGKKDLEKKIIRAIGEAEKRFQEDRLRMIRAVRFAARFGFEIEKETREAIKKQAHTLLPAVSMERVWQEWTKMAEYPHFDKAVHLLEEFGLLKVLFPEYKKLPSFENFPLDTPPIVYLLKLFPEHALEKRLEIAARFKVSTAELKILEFFTQSEELFRKKTTRVEWAHFYAHPLSALFLEIESLSLLPDQRKLFLEEHKQQEMSLVAHIQRLKEKRPVLTSAHLQAEGIPPGKRMGALLREGEKMAIENDLQTPSEVISSLKKSPLWAA